MKPNSLQTLETSPPLASIAKMGAKAWKANIVRVPPQGVHGPTRVKTHAQIQIQKIWRKSNYIEDQRFQTKKDDKMVKLITNEGSNQKIQKRIK
jgi:hypothetical protein